jgi:hypothetical protein
MNETLKDDIPELRLTRETKEWSLVPGNIKDRAPDITGYFPAVITDHS